MLLQRQNSVFTGILSPLVFFPLLQKSLSNYRTFSGEFFLLQNLHFLQQDCCHFYHVVRRGIFFCRHICLSYTHGPVRAWKLISCLHNIVAATALPGDCQGQWENNDGCSVSCGSGGTQAQTFHITQAASGTGAPCEAVEGATQTVSCSGPSACRMLFSLFAHYTIEVVVFSLRCFSRKRMTEKRWSREVLG